MAPVMLSLRIPYISPHPPLHHFQPNYSYSWKPVPPSVYVPFNIPHRSLDRDEPEIIATCMNQYHVRITKAMGETINEPTRLLPSHSSDATPPHLHVLPGYFLRETQFRHLSRCFYEEGSRRKSKDGRDMLESTSLQDRLKKLECQFTWDNEEGEDVNINHILLTLEVKIKHTTYQNHSTLYNLKAFLLQHQQRSGEALQCLEEAEELVSRDDANFTKRILATYGNYAWIYYQLDNFQKVETYLENINRICLALKSGSDYSTETAEMYTEQGWSLLAKGLSNGRQAKRCFTKALETYPDDNNLRDGLAYSYYGCAKHYDENIHDAISHLQEIVRRDPRNWEAKVYLADLLLKTNNEESKEMALELIEDDLVECNNPEILRIFAQFYTILSREKRIDILNRAINIAPDYYHLLGDLANTYGHQAYELRASEEKSRPIAEACRLYTEAIKRMPWNVNIRLDLANLYGHNNQTEFQEMVYSKMEAELPKLCRSYQQKFYFEKGNYLFFKKKNTEEALEMHKKGFKVNPGSKQGAECKKRLEQTANKERSRKREIMEFIRDTEKKASK
ncbi:interferon-induced protein with tetratricopeptide repeats 5-like [Discoglossus pictus]